MNTDSDWVELLTSRNISVDVAQYSARAFHVAGYPTLESVKARKHDQDGWRQLCNTAGVPDVVAEELSLEFGLPRYRHLASTPQERLGLILRAALGGSFATFQPAWKCDEINFSFLMHDTFLSFSRRIVDSGYISACRANDGFYDGDLTWHGAPKVVFFQASERGQDQSIYPRGVSIDAEKARMLVRPCLLALHSPECFRMYFVQVSEPRKPGGMYQLHVLFVPPTHDAIRFCDAHFLCVQSFTFQPFRYIPTARSWIGFNSITKLAFGGRGVKVNVCIAQSVPFPCQEDVKALSDVGSTELVAFISIPKPVRPKKVKKAKSKSGAESHVEIIVPVKGE